MSSPPKGAVDLSSAWDLVNDGDRAVGLDAGKPPALAPVQITKTSPWAVVDAAAERPVPASPPKNAGVASSRSQRKGTAASWGRTGTIRGTKVLRALNKKAALERQACEDDVRPDYTARTVIFGPTKGDKVRSKLHCWTLVVLALGEFGVSDIC